MVLPPEKGFERWWVNLDLAISQIARGKVEGLGRALLARWTDRRTLNER